MQLAKLQTPTTRKKTTLPEKPDVGDTVKETPHGDVTITRIKFQPTSLRRERFGFGTLHWAKFPLTEPALQELYR